MRVKKCNAQMSNSQTQQTTIVKPFKFMPTGVKQAITISTAIHFVWNFIFKSHRILINNRRFPLFPLSNSKPIKLQLKSNLGSMRIIQHRDETEILNVQKPKNLNPGELFDDVPLNQVQVWWVPIASQTFEVSLQSIFDSTYTIMCMSTSADKYEDVMKLRSTSQVGQTKDSNALLSETHVFSSTMYS